MNKKMLLPFYCQFLFSWFSLTAIAPIENKATLPILTPSFSERQTAKLQLDNGIQAYLVSDPNIDKSSAALTVKTGSWEDPIEYPGIAHFLEHMLFLGNSKYPEEAEYDRFMRQYAGQFNAFTANDFTGYVFTIDNSALPEALDRFSSFFKEPLFNPSGVDRELQAIDQEYAKNLENDAIREYFIFKEIANPGHPNGAFSMGNRESLQKVSRETLKNWYKTHYSANRMQIEIISPLPLEQLKSLAIHNFQDIPNHNIPLSTPIIPILSDASKGHMIYIEPVKHLRRLALTWELPVKFASMRDTKPEIPICHILGHEGKNSLLEELKYEKMAESVQCGTDKIGGNSFLLFLQIDLTDAGVKNVNQVILRCFEAIANLKQKGIPNYIVDELRTITQLNYQYQPSEDAFEHIIKEAMLLPNEGLETYPEQSLTFQKADLEATAELIQYLTPENCIFELLAPTSLTGVAFEGKEKWLGVPYTIKSIPEENLAAWKNAAPNAKIDLPESNPYLPENIELYSSHSSKDKFFSMPHPHTLTNNENGKIYFVPDNYYSVPTISWSFEIKTPAIDPADVNSLVLADLFITLAKESLNTSLYPASAAGLNFSLSRTNNGLSICIDGYNDKSQILFLELIKALKNFKPREQKFKTYKELALRNYRNNSLETPLVQSYELLQSILYKNFFLSKTKAAAIRKITFDQFQDFCQKLFRETYIEGMMYGNMKEGQAHKAASHFIAVLDSQPYPKANQPKEEIIVLPKNQGPFYIETKSKVQGNAALLTIAMESFSFKERAAQQILIQAIKEPFFSTLRTKQQTGYIVVTKDEELEQHLFDMFAVQSNTHEGRDLLARFELFIESFVQELDKTEVPREQFETIKSALLNTLKQPPKSMSEMSALLYRLAFSYEGDFNRVAEQIKAFEELTYEEFLESAYKVLGKENKQRFAILFSGSTPNENLKYQKLCGLGKLRELSTYEPSFLEPSNE